MADRKKIFIGIVAYQGCDPEILEDYMRLAFHCGRRMQEYDFFLGVKSKSEQFRARNALVEAAQKVRADYLYMLDDDMVHDSMSSMGPNESYDVISKLIAHGKDICGVLYYQRSSPCAAVLMKKVHEKGYRFLRDDEVTGRLQKVDVTGGGCLLINMKIFDKIQEPYFGPEYEYGTDIQLSRQAEKYGFEVWADTSIELGHLKNEKSIISSRTRHHHINDAVPGEAKTQFNLSDIFVPLLNDILEYTKYESVDEIFLNKNDYHQEWGKREKNQIDLIEWYRKYPRERIARQYWFNTQTSWKVDMTAFILASFIDGRPAQVLDYGCGIGVTAFNLADRGHDVDALDIAGTGTFEFLKWRVKKHNLKMSYIDRNGGPVDLGDKHYDAVIAMDVLEHIPDWKRELSHIARHIKEGGALFSNNAVLNDDAHAEHYHVDNREFVSECVRNNLMPLNQICYIKKEI